MTRFTHGFKGGSVTDCWRKPRTPGPRASTPVRTRCRRRIPTPCLTFLFRSPIAQIILGFRCSANRRSERNVGDCRPWQIAEASSLVSIRLAARYSGATELWPTLHPDHSRRSARVEQQHPVRFSGPLEPAGLRQPGERRQCDRLHQAILFRGTNSLHAAGRRRTQRSTRPRPGRLGPSLFKNIPISRLSESLRLQFRFEMFNALNHTNFDPPASTSIQLFTQALTPITSAGNLTATATTSRQLQLALKILW
jgi:hypothetical protein